MSLGVRVSLSSGDVFWVDTENLWEAKRLFDDETLVQVGGRIVNGRQVAQLIVEQVPSIESPERLEEAGHGAIS